MTPISILLKASILFLAAGLLQALWGRRMSAATRHLVWTLAAAGFLLVPVFSFVLPPWTIVTTAPENLIESPGIVAGQPHSPFDSVQIAEPLNISMEQRSLQANPAGFPWFRAFELVYASVAFVLLLRLIAEFFSAGRLMRGAGEVHDPEWERLLLECCQRMRAGRRIKLWRSHEQIMPAAFGILGGAIVIPAIADTWSEDRRRAVLLHEIAHVVRNDCLTQVLAAVVCSVYWVHPGAWWIARRLRVERELASDDRVLSLGTDEPRKYAGHLLDIAYSLQSGRQTALVVSMAGSGQLEKRLLAVLDGARNRTLPALRSHLLALGILFALLIPIAAATTAARQPAAPGSPVKLPGRSTFGLAVAGLVQAVSPESADAVGVWEVRPTGQARILHLQLREGGSSYSTTIDLDHTPELPAGFPGVGGPVHFDMRRDAGTFAVEGVIRNGVGAGTYTFAASATFPDELAKRGFERPGLVEQRLLARTDIGFAFLDELVAQHYARPAHLVELVQAARQGISLSYLRELGRLGYNGGTLGNLLNLSRHGVSPDFIRDLAAAGLPKLSIEDLLRARNSGVDGEYIRALASLGYAKLPLDELVQLRHHGVDADYARDLAAQGYPKLPVDTLIQLRNHGVDAEYSRELASAGYSNLTLDRLIELRNHGIDADYARELGALGYAKLPLDTLTELRNHGVDPDYVREMQSLGYTGIKIDDFVRMRNSGISPDQVRSANARAGSRLSVDNLVALASRGWR